MTSKQAYTKIVLALHDAYEISESTSIAAIVLEDGFGIQPHRIKEDIPFSAEQADKLDQIILRLLTHEPIQYVLGKTVFFGLPFTVNPNVLIPRQETEELVGWILETAGGSGCLLDIGTGSGCIPVAIKNKLREWEVHALDVSPGALQVAKQNAIINKAAIIFHELDILEKEGWGSLPKFDIIVSNPPYITEEEKDILPRNVIDYEPHLALFSGNNDAQRFIKKIAVFAAMHLNSGGYLFFETNEFYAEESKRIMEAAGFAAVEIKKDLNGKNRMIRGVI